MISGQDQPLTHQNTVFVLRTLASYKGQEGTAAALNTVLWSPGVTPCGVAPEGTIPSLGRLSNGTAPSDKPQGFRGRGYRGRRLVHWVQDSISHQQGVWPALCSPEMDRRRVPNTLPHSSFSCRPAPFHFPTSANGTFLLFSYVSFLIVYIDCPHFKMETVHSACASVHSSVWMFSFDFKAVYLQVPFHPGSFR